MRKILSIFMAAVICLSFAACGGNSAAESTPQQAVSDVLVRSSYDGVSGCYTNSYTQLTVTPPGDWYIYNDNDLAMAYLGGSVTGDEFAMWTAADFKNKDVIPDFAFQDMANSNNLSLVYVNLDMLENGADMDDAAFHSLVIKDMANQGRVLDQTDDEIITLCGREFYLFEFKGADASWYMAMKRQDNYMVVITATDRTGAGREMFFGFFE